MLTFFNISSFCSQKKCWFISPGKHNLLVRIANREGLDPQKQSDWGLLSRPFWQVTLQNIFPYTTLTTLSHPAYADCIQTFSLLKNLLKYMLCDCLIQWLQTETEIWLNWPRTLRNSYTMGCPPVHGDNPRALASGLSNVQVDKHGITILYHLH